MHRLAAVSALRASPGARKWRSSATLAALEGYKPLGRMLGRGEAEGRRNGGLLRLSGIQNGVEGPKAVSPTHRCLGATRERRLAASRVSFRAPRRAKGR
jgi:hypothetical protein